jgi:RES domain-containing protein
VRVGRLALGRYHVMDGEGARVFGGRWNSPGIPMVYAATQISLALVEQLVHVKPERMPDAFRALAIEVPNDAAVETAKAEVNPADRVACRQYGDDWAISLRTAILVVPSIVVAARLRRGEIETEERNILLNPRHASSIAWRIVETSFRVDPRLRDTR